MKKSLAEYIHLRTLLKETFFSRDTIRDAVRKDKEKKPLSGAEQFANDTGHLVAQLESVFDRLAMTALLVSTHHPRVEKNGFSRAAQFVYQVENYFSTMYVFDQRFKKVLRHIEKWANKKAADTDMQKNISRVRKIANKAFEPILQTRGNHVHDRNFFDQSLYYLELYDMMGSLETDQKQQRMYYEERDEWHRRLKKEWKKKIEDNNKASSALLGMMYELVDESYELLIERMHVK